MKMVKFFGSPGVAIINVAFLGVNIAMMAGDDGKSAIEVTNREPVPVVAEPAVSMQKLPTPEDKAVLKIPQGHSANTVSMPIKINITEDRKVVRLDGELGSKKIDNTTPIVPNIESVDESDDTSVEINEESEGVVEMEVSATASESDAKTVTVRSGDNLTKIFYRAGLSDRSVYEANKALSKRQFKVYPGDVFTFLIENEELVEMRVDDRSLEVLVLKNIDGKYEVSKEVKETEMRESVVSGTINSNLFVDGKKAGMTTNLVMELANIYRWDIDFALDLRKGDSFSVIYEEQWLEGKKIADGEIVAARFINDGKVFEAFRHVTSEGDVAYYDADGRSLQKAFIRSPVDFRRISSHFKPERYHPVLGVKRPHRGVDYAAKSGTKIQAAGAGKVTFAGVKGGYGNTIIIKHNNGIETLYAHQSKFAKGMKVGKRVKQGELIGYVGSTGVATGPHLHYEFRVNGQHKNPVTVKLPNDVPLDKKYKSDFVAKASNYKKMLDVIDGRELSKI